ncbi:MAG: hypothetical protein JSW25_08640 [Thermoplasmata archaeon]|nr:MAG: hypothetical protein JSW25_08640 [Thermoplasmata archaeon]
MRRLVVVGALLVAAMLLLAGFSLAGKDSGTETLDTGDHVAVTIPNGDGDALEVTVDIKVTSGPNVDAYFLDEENYEAYQAGEEFDSYEGYSEDDIDEFDTSFVFATKGKFFVVIESTATEANQTTTVEYKVSWESAYTFGFNWLWCITALFIVIILTAALAFMQMPKRGNEKPLPKVGGDEGP